MFDPQLSHHIFTCSVSDIRAFLVEVISLLTHKIDWAVLCACVSFSDFECILDKHLQPLPYSNVSTLSISDRERVQWGTSSRDMVMHTLPPGAQR